MHHRLQPAPGRPLRGFTLIELLVAISIMALMAVMGWRALAGMQQASTQTRNHSDAVLALEAGLAQWTTDLDAMTELPSTRAMDWDGRLLRITRRAPADASAGVIVVAWMQRNVDGTPQWVRWQSAPGTSRQSWLAAWQAAALWAQRPGEATGIPEAVIAPLAQWQLYYSRGGAWSNPLSSSGAQPQPGAASAPGADAVPDGVRLVLTIPSPHPLAGTLTRDWARASGAPAP